MLPCVYGIWREKNIIFSLLGEEVRERKDRMGLFSKQECVLCGGKAGMLTRVKLVNGDYICGDCRDRMSANVSGIGDMTLEEVEEQIRIKEENDRRFNEEFNVTRRFDFDSRHPMMAVDDDTGEFAILTDKKPDIYSFDQVISYNVDLNTRALTEEERKKKPGSGSVLFDVVDFFLSDDFGTRFPDLPRCPRDRKVSSMYFDIHFGPNPFNTEKLHIDMMPGWLNSEGDIEKAYICANEMYQCLKEYKNGTRTASNEDSMDRAAFSGGDQSVAAAGDVAEQLKKMKELLDMGILTPEEFDAKKRQILGI